MRSEHEKRDVWNKPNSQVANHCIIYSLSESAQKITERYAATPIMNVATIVKLWRLLLTTQLKKLLKPNFRCTYTYTACMYNELITDMFR
jgi:hypothetical protein